MTLEAWVQDFQTLIVGVIGFAGVIITLVLNARYAREQRREERRHECQSLRTALVEELRINRGWLVKNTERVIKDTIEDLPEDGGYLVPTDHMDDAYRTFTSRIGLLSPGEVRKVMYAYLSLRNYYAKLFLVGDAATTRHGHVDVPVKNAQMLSNMQMSLIGTIEEAITALERARDAG